VPARKRGPRRATAPKSAVADLGTNIFEIGKADFDWRLGRILRGSLTLAPQDDGPMAVVAPRVGLPRRRVPAVFEKFGARWVTALRA